jgi:hypothetical protein
VAKDNNAEPVRSSASLSEHTPSKKHSPVAEDNVRLIHDDRVPGDWATLFAKVFDDFIRILRGEVKLLGATIAPTIESVLMRSLNRLIMAAMAACGLFCLMVAAILLLHKWLGEWWQAFGLMGVSLLGIVILCSLLARKRSSSSG